jgi:uncharacterized repeat protein (TIGR01451 family)
VDASGVWLRVWRHVLLPASFLAAVSPTALGATSPSRPLATAVPPALASEGRLVPTGDALGDADDSFGASVAADGDTLAVGVPSHDLPTVDAGCVYVYERSGGAWTQTAKLTSPEAGTVSRFGSRVALEGDTLVAAAEPSWSQTRVYVYVRQAGAWTLQATLEPPVQAHGFGASLALSGDSLAVGASQADTGFGSRSGVAFVYTRAAGTWALEQEVLGFEIAGDDEFGTAVALDGDRLAVGAPYDDPGTALDAGSVYLFERSAGAWSQVVKLVDPAGGQSFRFGRALSLEAGTLAVGAPGQGDGRVHVYEEIAGVWIPRALLASTTATLGRFGGALALRAGHMLVGFEPYASSGAAEIFSGSGASWTPGTPLVPGGLDSNDEYGAAVALTDGTAIVGAPYRLQTGAAWIWTGSGSTWAIQAELDNAGTATHDAFGSASALEDTTLVVGAPADDTVSGRDSGAAYVYERVGTAWALRQKLVPPPGTPGVYSWEGPRFGTSVALSGDRLAIGAPHARQQGRVFVFARAAGTWSLAAELAPSDPSSYADFGTAVALRGTRLLVGAPQAAAGTRTGAVYAFEETAGAWVPRQKVVSFATASGFGAALAVAPTGTIAVAGAVASASASVLALTAGAWAEVLRLTPPKPDSPGDFGRAVAVTETDAFVGAPMASGPASYGVGAVHVFRSSGGTWTEGPLLEPATDDSGQYFGSAIAVDGTRLAIGAPASYDEGAVHLFEAVAGGWTPASVLEGEGVGQDPRFGSSLAAHGGRVVAGEPGADSPAGEQSGLVHVFGPSTSDLAIAIAGPASAPQGALVTVGVQITNSGPSPVAGAGFRASVGDGLAVESWSLASGACSRAGAVLTCPLPTVPVGTSAVAEIRVAAVAVGNWPIVASLTSFDSNPANDTATLDLAVSPSAADVSLSVSGPAYARVGGTLHYQIALANAGPGAAAGLAVEMIPPPGLVLGSVVGCDPADCRITRLDTEYKWLYVDYQVPADYAGPVPIVFSASVSTLSQDPQPGNNLDSQSTPFVPPPTPLGYYTVTPCRLYDSRAPGEMPLAPGEVRVLWPYGAACGPAYGARALALNVTVTGATAAGNVRVYPAYSPVPNVSVVNYTPGLTRASNVVVGLSPEGDLAVLASQASGSVHVVLDVVGYFQ